LKRQFEKPKRIFKTTGGAKRRPTINIGGVFTGTSGDKANTIPAQVMFTIDRRIPPNEHLRDAESELKAAIREACKSVSGLKVTVKSTLRIEPCLVDPAHPLVQEFARAVRTVRRNPVQFVPTTGFTDLHYFVEGGKIPGVGYGVRGKGAHGVNERVRISDLIKCCKTYAAFMAGARL
jgi:acetylornithine deacetylase